MIEILVWVTRVLIVGGFALMTLAWALFRKPDQKFWSMTMHDFTAPKHLQDRGKAMWSLGRGCFILGAALHLSLPRS